jgi:hypothetical protein
VLRGRADAAVKRQFADAERVVEAVYAEIAGGPEDAESDRQVECRTFLANVGGRKIYRRLMETGRK